MKKYNQFIILSLLLLLPIFSIAKVPSIGTKSKTALNTLSKIVDKVTVNCNVEPIAEPVYAGRLLSIDVPTAVDPNQLFNSTIKVVNTGNTPWFSIGSGCPGQSPTFLGTTREKDRASIFHAPMIFGDTKWYQSNRIKMKTPRVDPGETAEFIFASHAPSEPGIYREYFAPVIEGKAWLTDEAEFGFDIKVGQPEEDENVLKYTREIPVSLNLTDPKFSGDKKILVDLSEQKMHLKLGDLTIKTFTVSSGKPKTPTPVGTTKIQFKQEVRVAGSYPHYIMPKFMQFRAGGYGIHALPSLANDRGVFWREALNHIGSPRSHGCIRLLPEDANFTYDFADVGTEVKVVW
ncbi:L,D-transpeptidase family protein [Candidatus Peregrinibacteria bacterium]|nr:L,D-transpeptidase family protein [Candidatus Peregrinibacteria bacterium]